MSRSTPSTLPATARTVLEIGARRSLEVSRTVPLATGTNPPSSGLDAHLIAIGTPPPGTNATAEKVPEPEPRTVFLGGAAYIRPSRPVPSAALPRASLALASLLGLFALALAPLGPIAWLHAAEQLDLISRGVRSDRGARWLHAMQGIGIAMTMIAVAATAFGVTVMVARTLR